MSLVYCYFYPCFFFGSITLSVIFQSDDDRVVHDLQQGWASALVLPGTFLTRENKTKWKRGKVIHGIFWPILSFALRKSSKFCILRKASTCSRSRSMHSSGTSLCRYFIHPFNLYPNLTIFRSEATSLNSSTTTWRSSSSWTTSSSSSLWWVNFSRR